MADDDGENQIIKLLDVIKTLQEGLEKVHMVEG